MQHMAFLAAGEILDSTPDTLTVSINPERPISLSFFSSMKIGRVGTPDQASDNGVWIASLLDLAATKMTVVQQRAESKDYVDTHAILNTGLSLEEALGAAQAVYGKQFNAAITLKALSYFEDGDLSKLPRQVQDYLIEQSTGVRKLSRIRRVSDELAPEP